MSTAAIIQARMGSTRLPGKIMADIEGEPLLAHVIERTRAAHLVEQVIIATTGEEEDEVVVDFTRERDLPCFTGSLEDVLDRFYQAAMKFNVTTIVRITPDDPFKDPTVIDRVIGRFQDAAGTLDYASNTLKPTFPEGLDVEVFSFPALKEAWTKAKMPSEREHVTPYIWNHPEHFRLANVENSEDLSALRWTIDYEADLRFAREVYARFPRGRLFTMGDILELMKAEPALAEINRGTARNEGYLKSLQKEKTR